MTMPGPIVTSERERRLLLWTGLALAVAALLGVGVAWRNARTSEPAAGSPSGAGERPAGEPGALGQAAPVPPSTPSELPQPGAAQPDAGRPLSNTVRVVFKTFPGVRASVTWGKQRLGFVAPRAPLVVERPRDSGPLDVVVRAPGFLPVHTRAYTFDDSLVEVKLTTYAKKNTIYGYREPLPSADAGAPPYPL